MRKKLIMTSMAILPLMNTTASAQDFVDLASSQMRIDTVYTPLNRKQRRKYRKLTGSTLAPKAPQLTVATFKERKSGTLAVEFTPIVEQDGRLCYVNSFQPVLLSAANATANTMTAASIFFILFI